jgi:hypothetical protein
MLLPPSAPRCASFAPVTDAQHRVRIDMVDSFEYTLAGIGRGWTKTSRPFQLKLADSHGSIRQDSSLPKRHRALTRHARCSDPSRRAHHMLGANGAWAGVSRYGPRQPWMSRNDLGCIGVDIGKDLMDHGAGDAFLQPCIDRGGAPTPGSLPGTGFRR